MTKTVSILILFAAVVCIAACNHAGKKSSDLQPVKIIFDTDMGSDCDDAGALALLHVFADEGKAEILGCIYSSGAVPFGAGIVEAINIYYGRPGIPVGASYGNEVGDPVDKMSAQKLARDTAAFKNRIIHNFDAEEQTRLNRRLLAGQEDQSVTYLTVGHTKGIYDLLVSPPDDISPLSGYELIESKLTRWVALGALGANNPGNQFVKDWNFFRNGTAPYTQYVVENLPVPAIFVDGGESVMTGKSLKETPAGNIVRTVYRDWLWNYEKKTLDGQRPSWDLVTVYYAVEGMGEFFSEVEAGWLEYSAEEGGRWLKGDNPRKHTFLRQIEGTNERFADYLNERIGRRPAAGYR